MAILSAFALTPSFFPITSPNGKRKPTSCGKLICCLSYEDDLYTEAKKDFPRIGTVIHHNGVDYTVETYNVLARSVKVSNAEGYEFISLDDFNSMAKKTPAPTTGAKSPNA
jgi:Uncharacterized homolog of PSP1